MSEIHVSRFLTTFLETLHYHYTNLGLSTWLVEEHGSVGDGGRVVHRRLHALLLTLVIVIIIAETVVAVRTLFGFKLSLNSQFDHKQQLRASTTNKTCAFPVPFGLSCRRRPCGRGCGSPLCGRWTCGCECRSLCRSCRRFLGVVAVIIISGVKLLVDVSINSMVVLFEV